MCKKSLRVIASLLLLCFSVTALPLDFFHTHTTKTSCSEGARHSTCHHKLHISKAEYPCFACNVHFDKTFILSESVVTLLEISDVRLLPAKRVEFYFEKLSSHSSRGPPSIHLI